MNVYGGRYKRRGAANVAASPLQPLHSSSFKSINDKSRYSQNRQIFKGGDKYDQPLNKRRGAAIAGIIFNITSSYLILLKNVFDQL